MYSIIRLISGLYKCRCKVQDSTEEWIDIPLSKAIINVRSLAEEVNHEIIEIEDIKFSREVVKSVVEYVPCSFLDLK